MSRRSPGEGSIVLRKDGRWQGSLQRNKQRVTVYGRIRSEADAKLTKLKILAPPSEHQPTWGRHTLNDLLDVWLAAKEPNLKPRTLFDYRQICDRYLRPALGTLSLGRVTPDRVQGLYGQYQRQGKARTALKLHQVLSQALAMAVRWGWLAYNPCDRVDRPRYQAARKTLWTSEQLQAFLDGTREHWLHPLWVVAISTGARLGELLAVTWEDVDLETAVLRIDKSVQTIEGERIVTSPKTEYGTRQIRISSATMASLRSWRAQQAEQRLRVGAGWSAGHLVFSGANGGPLSANTVQDALLRECDRLALPRTSPHGLRHLHASLLLGNGLAIPAVSRRLGHANPSITMSIYAHALSDSETQAVGILDRALSA